MNDPLPVYVINRAQDRTRLDRFSASALAVGADYTRIEAFDGHDPAAPWFLYRDLLGPHFWGKDRVKPGAFACFLSHLAAWRRMLADGHDAALIAEDDAVLTIAPALPADVGFDIIFCNARMADWAKTTDALTPVADMLAAMSASGAEPGKNGLSKGPGADAYVISRTGAERLIAAVTEHRFTAGIDWMMLAMSVSPGAVPDWAELSGLDTGLSLSPPLEAYIMHPAISEGTTARSVIGHKVTVPIADLGSAYPVSIGPTADTTATLVPEPSEADPVAAAFRQGTYPELPALEMMRRWFPRGGTYVDIGAHIGAHMLFMLRHGGASRAIPFEFHEGAIAALSEAVLLNNLTDAADLSHLGFGLAEDASRRAVRGPGLPAYDQRLKPDFVEDIRVRPGDALLRTEAEIAMIKIDVNGEEREVLKGLKKTLKRKAPLLVLDMTIEKAAKSLPLLERLGYTEAERAEWQDDTGQRRVVLFRPPPPQPPSEAE